VSLFRYISVCLLFILNNIEFQAQADRNKLDSLFQVLGHVEDTSRLSTLKTLSEAYIPFSLDSSHLYANLLLQEAKNLDNLSFTADAFNMIGYALREMERMEESYVYFQKALDLRLDLKEYDKASMTLNLVGTAYHRTGDVEKSLDYYMQSIVQAEINGNPKYLSSPISNIGRLYYDMGDNEKALEYDLRALAIARDSDDFGGMALAYNNLGTIYQETGHLDTAKLFYKEAMRLYEETRNHSGAAHMCNNMAIIYFMEGNTEEALLHFRMAMKMRLASRDMISYSQSLMNMGLYYQIEKKFDSAIFYVDSSIEIALDHNALLEQRDCYFILAECYESKAVYKESLEAYKSYLLIKDSVMDENGLKNIQEMETKYQTKEQQKELELKDLKIKQEAEEKKYAESKKTFQFQIIGITGAGMLLILILIGRGYFAKRKSNIKLADINEELESQKSIIEEKNKDITDSIIYAQKIQEAMLHSHTDVSNVFPDSFIIYKPKDIVAGDFYWWVNEGNRFYLAAADCTGHGVPGAMISVACANILNKSLKELGLSKPSDILDKTTELVVEAFSVNENEQTYMKDGMDIALCAIEKGDKDNVTIEFSGANNPLWIFRKNGAFEEIRGDRQPIGYFEKQKPFTNSSITLEKGDTIYIFSDGYADQFGGGKNKKFKSSNLKKKLLSIQSSSLEVQKEILEKEFEEWKGDFAQTDDVCVIGVKV
jgi:serine phosphatase RsbU (regulator of sigma subunit)/Tfp pilus assembly protein PilF